MSIRKNTTITCPQCGKPQEFLTWPSLNVDLDPDQKGRLLSGELLRFQCDRCGHSLEVHYPLLYHDMTRRLMIYHTAGVGTEELSSPLFQGRTMEGYTLRVVTSRNELVEKVWISTTALDDRVVELFKIVLEDRMNLDTPGELLFSGMDRGGNGEELLGFAWVTAKGSESIMVPLASYQDFSRAISPVIGPAEAKPGEWQEIDRQYAIGVFREHFSGG